MRQPQGAAAEPAPGDPNVLLTLARFYYSTGKSEQAEQMLGGSVSTADKE